MKYWSRTGKIIFWLTFVTTLGLEALLVFQIPRPFVANLILTLVAWVVTGGATIFMHGAGDVSNGTPFPGAAEFITDEPVYTRPRRATNRHGRRKKAEEETEE